MSGATPQPRRPRARRAALVVPALLCVAASVLAASGYRQVDALFREARYEEAARLAADLATDHPATAEALYWRMRLETAPAAALAAMRAGLANEALPASLRARFALERAGVEYARGRHAAALEALDQVRRLRGAPLAGDAALWAESATRALALGSEPKTVRQPAAAPAGEAAAPPRRVAPVTSAGRAGAGVAYALQLGAFAEEKSARALLARYRPELPELALVAERGQDGAPLYKVRLGAWADRDAAVAAAGRLRRELGLEAIVVELAGRP